MTRKSKLMTEECLYCGADVESDNYQQYCNDYCEEKSDMELLDIVTDEEELPYFVGRMMYKPKKEE